MKISKKDIQKIKVVVKRGPIEDMPRRKRTAVSVVELLSGWPALKETLDGGLGEGEAVYMRLPSDNGIAPRTISRFLQKYVKSVGHRYTVKHAKREDAHFYQVSNPVVITKPRRKVG